MSLVDMNKKIQPIILLAFILTFSIFMSGCAALLIGAGAAGGYHVAKEH